MIGKCLGGSALVHVCVTVDAAVLTTPIRVEADIEGYVRTVVVAQNPSGWISIKLGLDSLSLRSFRRVFIVDSLKTISPHYSRTLRKSAKSRSSEPI